MNNKSAIESIITAFLPYFFIFIFVITCIGSLSGYIEHNHFKMGDWLINYQGGYTRRGLTGELFYQLAVLSNINSGIYVLLIQNICYALFFIFSYLLLKKQQQLLPYLLLIMSPFIFTFQLNDLQGGYRKEILYFVLLSFTAYTACSFSKARFEQIFYLILLSFPLLILSHEMLAIYLPYILAIYISKIKINKKRMIIIALLLLPTLLSLALSLYSPIDYHSSKKILHATQQAGYPLSEKAIYFLDKDFSFMLHSLWNKIPLRYYIFYYISTIILALIAFYPIRSLLNSIFNYKAIRALLLSSLVTTLILCSVAIDWGRFIYIHLVSIFILSLTLPSHYRQNQQNKNIFSIKLQQPNQIFLIFIFCIAYSLLWHIPHCRHFYQNTDFSNWYTFISHH